ncbi:MAG: phosphomethylpyrimidine synthase ThiC [Candidatus Thermoplasmatota archaeon]|nr:phosphomethylpyrimidine synthase ThiC [Candidatus Thermoplasmatota archaeon]
MRVRKGASFPQEMKGVAKREGMEPGRLARLVRDGRAVIPSNPAHRGLISCAIGEGLRVKVNANIGTSRDYVDLAQELEKARVAIMYGADAIMDLSTGGDLRRIRRKIVSASTVPVGTVPIYEAVCKSSRKGGLCSMTSDDLFKTIERHAQDGIDFMTVHCGVTKATADSLKKHKRVTGVVSRGGALLIAWMHEKGLENPLYEDFDHLLDMAKEHEFALSLGDGLRPGSIADASDVPQLHELLVLGKLVERARAAGVQAMVEGPGHIPLNEIEANVRLEKAVCKGAPFYVLGPLVSDVGAGYDHITGAIGGALAAYFGADFLCYVTPSEHLSLPTAEDVREGVAASRIAAHAADVARGRLSEWDREMSVARKAFDWERMFELSVDPERARALHDRRRSKSPKVCSMCGELCAMKVVDKVLRD